MSNKHANRRPLLLLAATWLLGLALSRPAPAVACPPAVHFTSVPPYGSFANLHGQVSCVDPATHEVAVYIYVGGWWTKPAFDQPHTPIAADGSWQTDITTGGSDQEATKIAAFVVPDTFPPELMSGGAPLPEPLFANSVAFTHTERTSRTLTFAGRTWHVKSADCPAGPGPNYFSDDPSAVWVDGDGRLHLTISQQNGQWVSTEVFTTDFLGYGDYTFTIDGAIDQLNEQVVLGLFTWDSVAPAAQYSREIDVEWSRWGDPQNANNAQFVVQPYHTPGNLYPFNLALSGGLSTHSFRWEPTTIAFASQDGVPAAGSPFPTLVNWTYTGGDIPTAGNANGRINLWLVNGQPPTDGQPVEVIVQAFDYAPLDPTAVTLTTAPATKPNWPPASNNMPLLLAFVGMLSLLTIHISRRRSARR